MSTLMSVCPWCERRVLGDSGRCPACHGDLTDTAGAERRAVQRKAAAEALAERARGLSYGEIEEGLVRRGIDSESRRAIMMEVEGKTPQGMAGRNALEMRHGIYWLVGGVLFSTLTYALAAWSGRGGLYFIAWGPVLFGGIRFIRAWLKTSAR